MRFINKWGAFINEEWSQNDPIPELRLENNYSLQNLNKINFSISSYIRSLLLIIFRSKFNKQDLKNFDYNSMLFNLFIHRRYMMII